MRLRSTPASHRAALLKRWKVDGSQTPATQPVVQPIDLAAKARVLKENLWDDIGYIRVWDHACRNGESSSEQLRASDAALHKSGNLMRSARARGSASREPARPQTNAALHFVASCCEKV